MKVFESGRDDELWNYLNLISVPGIRSQGVYYVKSYVTEWHQYLFWEEYGLPDTYACWGNL